MNEKKVIGRIVDKSGDSQFEGSLSEAVSLVDQQTKSFAKWVYVKGEDNKFAPFFFDNHEKAELERFKTKLGAAENPEFMITGSLQGGQ